jgi:hypothetical protein
VRRSAKFFGKASALSFGGSLSFLWIVPALALGLSRLDAKMPKASMKMKVRLYPQFPSAKRESMNNPPMP